MISALIRSKRTPTRSIQMHTDPTESSSISSIYEFQNEFICSVLDNNNQLILLQMQCNKRERESAVASNSMLIIHVNNKQYEYNWQHY